MHQVTLLMDASFWLRALHATDQDLANWASHCQFEDDYNDFPTTHQFIWVASISQIPPTPSLDVVLAVAAGGA
jgi:hypothetical protein